MGIDINYLLLLQSLREATGGAFDEIFNGISKFAVDILPLLPFVILWCADKKWGYRFLATMYLGEVINGIIKLTVCAYRPWIRSDAIEPAGDSKVAATGYSFPSGHTMCATTGYGTLFTWQKNKRKWLAILCIVLIALTGFSRNFLGVHTPQDVLVGMIESVAIVLLVGIFVKKISGDDKKINIVSLIGIVFVIVAILYIKLKPYPLDYVDGELLVDPVAMMKDCFKGCGKLLGLIAGCYIERKYIRYEIPFEAKCLPILTCTGAGLAFAWDQWFYEATVVLVFGKNWGGMIGEFILVMFGVVLWPFVIRKYCRNDRGKMKKITSYLLVIAVIFGFVGMTHAVQAPANTPGGVDSAIPTITPSSSSSADKDLDKLSSSLSHEDYKLEQVVVFSRHNIRSPISGSGSVLGDITPHDWFHWSSNPSELSLRGGILETQMGQYFRKWLESEGLFDENYRPDGDKVCFYSNSKQRTIATAQYFSSGLLPVANSRIQYKADYDTMDAVFNPQFTFVSDAYKEAVKKQISELFSDEIAGLEDNYELLTDVIGMKESALWKEGKISEFKTDDTEILIQNNSEPGMTGSLKTACSVSDALVLQYYEEADEKKAAFGHELNFEQWRALSEIKDTYQDVLFTAPLVAVNVANPALKQIKKEMNTEGREFSFLCGHDSNLASILTSLGVEKYELPGSIEKRTSIGSKIVFAKYKSETGEEFWDVNLVYQKADQLRNLSLLDIDNPPAIYPLTFQGLNKNEDGLYKAEDFENRLDESIRSYDEIEQVYADKVAA